MGSAGSFLKCKFSCIGMYPSLIGIYFIIYIFLDAIQMATAEEDDLAGVQDASSEDEGYSYEDDMSRE